MTDDNKYNTDLEAIGDYLKLALGFDRKNTGDSVNDNELVANLATQKQMLKLLTTTPPKSNRIANVYKLFLELYDINKVIVTEILDDKLTQYKEQKDNHFIVLFYKKSCGSCQSIMGVWKQFKEHCEKLNFNVIEYDSLNPANEHIFKYFKIMDVPTILKLQLDAKDRNNIVKKLNKDINFNNLCEFATF
jgi:thiol-disulfide isomerase/thioredoxin